MFLPPKSSLDVHFEFILHKDMMQCIDTCGKISLRSSEMEIVQELTDFVQEIAGPDGQEIYLKQLDEAFKWISDNNKHDLFNELKLRDGQWVAQFVHYKIQERLHTVR